MDAKIFGPLVNLLKNAEFNIKKEAAWAISNATAGGSHEQIKYLVSEGCIQPLRNLLIEYQGHFISHLTLPDPRTLRVFLEGIENMLKVGEADKNIGNTADVNQIRND